MCVCVLLPAWPQPEVRVVAGATLSGMLRGMPEAEADLLRAGLLAQARTLLQQQKVAATGRGGAGAVAAAGVAGVAAVAAAEQVQAQQQLLLERHGLVQVCVYLGVSMCMRVRGTKVQKEAGCTWPGMP